MSFCFLYNVVSENHSVQNSPRGGGRGVYCQLKVYYTISERRRIQVAREASSGWSDSIMAQQVAGRSLDRSRASQSDDFNTYSSTQR